MTNSATKESCETLETNILQATIPQKQSREMLQTKIVRAIIIWERENYGRGEIVANRFADSFNRKRILLTREESLFLVNFPLSYCTPYRPLCSRVARFFNEE